MDIPEGVKTIVYICVGIFCLIPLCMLFLVALLDFFNTIGKK